MRANRQQNRSLLLPGVHTRLLQMRLDYFIGKVFLHLKPTDPFSNNWLVGAMAHQLTMVEQGNLKRLIINVPPRHLKSICTSVAFPAFVLGQDPTATIILVCYTTELGEKMMRDLRNVMASDWYKRVFPRTRLAKNTATEFTTTRNGGVNLTSVEGTLTGRGARIIIVDDPIKAGEASSAADRKRANEWFQSTLFSRLDDKRTGSIVVAMQRLHEDDVTGHLTDDPEHDWSVMVVPAIATEPQTFRLMQRGDLVWHHREAADVIDPAREDRETLERMRREIGTLIFEAQYQQNPVAHAGNLVKREWFKTYALEELPDRFDAVIASWDTASGTNASNDYSVGTFWGMTSYRCYLLDLVRVRRDFPDMLRVIVRETRKRRVNRTLIERASSGTGLYQMLNRQGLKDLSSVTPRGSKEDRLVECSPLIEAGKVLIPEQADWRENFLNEISGFPNSKHDDQVDSLTQFLKFIQRLRGPLVYDVGGNEVRQRRSRESSGAKYVWGRPEMLSHE